MSHDEMTKPIKPVRRPIRKNTAVRPRKRKAVTNTELFFRDAVVRRETLEFSDAATIFSQGDPSDTVMYVQHGRVKLSVVSKTGKEAVVAVLDAGNFFGEGCLAGQSRRMSTATAMSPTTILVVTKDEMVRRLHENVTFADRFLSHMLMRNIRIEEDLIDQLFNSSEKRLARTLLLLAHYGEERPPVHAVPRISQELLAEMVGTTRSRVNFFMNKFRKLGLIEYNGKLKVHSSLLAFVLHDGPREVTSAPAAVARASRNDVNPRTRRSRAGGRATTPSR